MMEINVAVKCHTDDRVTQSDFEMLENWNGPAISPLAILEIHLKTSQQRRKSAKRYDIIQFADAMQPNLKSQTNCSSICQWIAMRITLLRFL
jgi:hypothetical protein